MQRLLALEGEAGPPPPSPHRPPAPPLPPPPSDPHLDHHPHHHHIHLHRRHHHHHDLQEEEDHPPDHHHNHRLHLHRHHSAPAQSHDAKQQERLAAQPSQQPAPPSGSDTEAFPPPSNAFRYPGAPAPTPTVVPSTEVSTFPASQNGPSPPGRVRHRFRQRQHESSVDFHTVTEPTTPTVIGQHRRQATRYLLLWQLSMRGLRAVNHIAKQSDPFCILTLGQRKVETPVLKRTLNPCWAGPYYMPLPSDDAELAILVRDWSLVHRMKPLGIYRFRVPRGETEGAVEAAPLQAAEDDEGPAQGTVSFRWSTFVDGEIPSATVQRAFLREEQAMEERVQGRVAKLQGGPLGWLLSPHVVHALAGHKERPMDVALRLTQPGCPKGTLTVKCIVATNLRGVVCKLDTLRLKTSDPYCAVRIHSSVGTDEAYTKVAHRELNPFWLEPLVLDVWEPDSRLELTILHWSHLKDTELGMVSLALGPESSAGEWRKPLKPCPSGDPDLLCGNVRVEYEYIAPRQCLDECVSERVVASRSPSFGKIILRDLMVTGLKLSDRCCPVLTCMITSNLGRQTKQTKILLHSTRPFWQEFVTFDIYERGMELCLELMDATEVLMTRDRPIGCTRLAIPDRTTHDVIRARLLEEKQNRARVVGTISFSLSVIYAQSHEFWSSFMPPGEMNALDAYRHRRKRPKFNARILRNSGLMVYQFTVVPIQGLWAEFLELISWRRPLLSLGAFLGSLLVCYRGWLFQAFSLLLLGIFPRTYWRQKALTQDAERFQQMANAREQDMQQRAQMRARRLAARRQRKREVWEERRRMLRDAKEKLEMKKHVPGVPLLELAHALQRDMKERWYGSDTSSDDSEHEANATLVTGLMGYATWNVYEMHGLVEDYLSYFTWQDSSQTRELFWYGGYFVASTFIIPFHAYMLLLVLYFFTLHGLYVRYPLLWERFPPWRLALMLPRSFSYFCAEVRLTVQKAEGLIPSDVHTGKADPYVVVTLPRSGLRYSTSVKHNTLDPVWNEEMPLLYIRSRGSRIILEVWDYNFVPFSRFLSRTPSDFCGVAQFHVWGPEEGLQVRLALKHRPGVREYCTGYLTLRLSIRMLTAAQDAELIAKGPAALAPSTVQSPPPLGRIRRAFRQRPGRDPPPSQAASASASTSARVRSQTLPRGPPTILTPTATTPGLPPDPGPRGSEG